ncbi:hypothetical protein OAS39_04015 [Pirellulales bacterium]|nr:hypothetical protein [Pirellulales bacterium]
MLRRVSGQLVLQPKDVKPSNDDFIVIGVFNPGVIKNEVGAYSTGALLLGRNDPTRILKRSRGAIMQPTANCELQGFVPNAVFPTAMIKNGDALHMYYGAADTCIGVVEFLRHDLLEALY